MPSPTSAWAFACSEMSASRSGTLRRPMASSASRPSIGTCTTATAPRRCSIAIPRVLTISLHQDNLFPPDSGSCEENGEAEGKGFNINIPLPPGCGNGAYVEAMRRVVIPALQRYRPELIVVPCGFDAAGVDPLGRMMVSSEGYRDMTRLLVDGGGRAMRRQARDGARGRLFRELRPVLRPRRAGGNVRRAARRSKTFGRR